MFCSLDGIAGEETGQMISDFAEAWNLIRNSLEMYGKCQRVFPKNVFALIICEAFCDFGACGGTTSSAEYVTLNDVNKFYLQRTALGKPTLATFNN